MPQPNGPPCRMRSLNGGLKGTRGVGQPVQRRGHRWRQPWRRVRRGSATPGSTERVETHRRPSIQPPKCLSAFACAEKARIDLNLPCKCLPRILPETSLTSPPWTRVTLPDPREETQHHQEVVQRVNELIATGQYGRLFAVVHFASRQWKVTDGDLILIENTLEAKCGERIRLEKVLLVGAEDFTLIGKPLLGLDLVRVEATVIEKTESWPRIYMKFKKRKNYRKKKIFIRPQTILRINTVEIAPSLS